jgi:hypothetical protein
MWVGSGQTDLKILGLHDDLGALSVVRWTEEAAGPTPFVLYNDRRDNLQVAARNNAINFGDAGNFPDNAHRRLRVPVGDTVLVFDSHGCQFASGNRFYGERDHDLAWDNFANKASSMWTIRL